MTVLDQMAFGAVAYAREGKADTGLAKKDDENSRR
jgi:hypothetical protein